MEPATSIRIMMAVRRPSFTDLVILLKVISRFTIARRNCKGADCACLGRREISAHDPPDNQDKDDMMIQKTSGRARILAPHVDRSDLGAMAWIHLGRINDTHKEQGNDQSRDDASEKELANGLFRENP